jgi:hypothetical protein
LLLIKWFFISLAIIYPSSAPSLPPPDVVDKSVRRVIWGRRKSGRFYPVWRAIYPKRKVTSSLSKYEIFGEGWGGVIYNKLPKSVGE